MKSIPHFPRLLAVAAAAAVAVLEYCCCCCHLKFSTNNINKITRSIKIQRILQRDCLSMLFIALFLRLLGFCWRVNISLYLFGMKWIFRTMRNTSIDVAWLWNLYQGREGMELCWIWDWQAEWMIGDYRNWKQEIGIMWALAAYLEYIFS